MQIMSTSTYKKGVSNEWFDTPYIICFYFSRNGVGITFPSPSVPSTVQVRRGHRVLLQQQRSG